MASGLLDGSDDHPYTESFARQLTLEGVVLAKCRHRAH
jgi:hypothetical protein